MRMTTFSPCWVGNEAIRRSTACPTCVDRAAPSWGRRRSAMSSAPRIFRREAGAGGGAGGRGGRPRARRRAAGNRVGGQGGDGRVVFGPPQVGLAGERRGQVTR